MSEALTRVIMYTQDKGEQLRDELLLKEKGRRVKTLTKVGSQWQSANPQLQRTINQAEEEKSQLQREVARLWDALRSSNSGLGASRHLARTVTELLTMRPDNRVKGVYAQTKREETQGN